MPASESTRLVGGDSEGSWSSYARQIVIAGTGFLADAYDLFVIDLVLAILHRLHPGEHGINAAEKSLVASATLVGAVIGQLTFGLLGDWLGRKWTFLVTCILIVLGALGSACVVWTEGPFTLIYQLAMFRFMLGVGVGGEYPLSASIAAENSSRETRGRLIATVFSMQGWGMLLSSVLTLLFLLCGMPLEAIWRTLLALGALPSAMVIWLRANMEETELHKKDAESHSGGQSRVSFSEHWARAWKVMSQYWRPLIGTTMTWLILDITFYGTGSFKSRIGGLLVSSDANTDEEHIWHVALLTMYVTLMAIPGYLLSIAFIERIGRYNLQLGGFLAMSCCFWLMAYCHRTLTGDARWTLVFLFGLTFLFSNFGPNTTTFIVPVEIYPTVIRATCHGLSAASGKVGAVIGAVAFSPLEDEYGIMTVLICCGVVTLTGAAFTFAFTDDKILDLAELDKTARSFA
jgi:PHS family inorganic phosphate transporter-like MFS transporter